MSDVLSRIFDPTGFPQRWQCGEWSAAHGWLHIISDILIFGAYTAIPVLLFILTRRRPDFPFRRIMLLFVAFIMFCGISHLLEAIIFWNPLYRLAGMVKAITAVVSWATFAALIVYLPGILRLPGLATVNEQLELEISERGRLERRFRRVFDAAPSAMILVDADGIIQLANRAADSSFGYGDGGLVGREVEALIPDRLRADHPDYREVYAKDPTLRPMGKGRDLRAVRKNGEEFSVEVGLTPMDTPEGFAVLASIVDITERKRTEEILRNYSARLEDRNRELDAFAHTIAHDLKQPVRGIRHFAEFIREDVGDSLAPEVDAHLTRIEALTAKMGTQIHSLLEFARVGRDEGKWVDLDPGAVARRISEEIMVEEGWEHTLEIEPELPRVEVDSGQFDELLQNLISNAIKYSKQERPCLRLLGLHPEATSNRVTLAIEDDGPGIPEQLRERAFELFQRLGDDADDQEGSGVGLAIVRRIVERHGGSVSIEDGPGGGCRVVFSLPAAEAMVKV